MIGTPVRCAAIAAPGANTCAGPRGPSGVTAALAAATPARESRPMSARLAAPRRRAAHRGVAEAFGDARDDLAVAMLADHHRDPFAAMVPEQRQQLAVPEREDDALVRRARRPVRSAVVLAYTPRDRQQRGSRRAPARTIQRTFRSLSARAHGGLRRAACASAVIMRGDALRRARRRRASHARGELLDHRRAARAARIEQLARARRRRVSAPARPARTPARPRVPRRRSPARCAGCVTSRRAIAYVIALVR